MTKYMIQLDESNHMLIGNNKTSLIKAYKEAVKETYNAYLNCCESLEESPVLTLSDLLEFNQIEAYDESFIKCQNYTVQYIN